MNIIKVAKAIGVKYGPEILAGVAIAGAITSVVSAIYATPKAIKLIEEREEEEQRELTKPEVVKTVWKCYVPTAITLGTTAACIIFSDRIHVKRTAALATAYTLSDTAFKEYRAKVIEELGKDKDKQVIDEVAKDRLAEAPKPPSTIFISGGEDVLCYDSLFNRYFKSRMDKIQKAVNEVNYELMQEMYVSVNELYSELGLPPIEGMGDDLGWNVGDGLIEIDYSTQLSENDEPCLVLGYRLAPRYDFISLH